MKATATTQYQSLAYNICAAAISSRHDYTFISKGEILQTRLAASRLFPADYQLARIDKLVRKHSCFDSMSDLLSARGGYRPTLYCNAARTAQDRAELKQIADYYDACMEQIGDDRRAYRV